MIDLLLDPVTLWAFTLLVFASAFLVKVRAALLRPLYWIRWPISSLRGTSPEFLSYWTRGGYSLGFFSPYRWWEPVVVWGGLFVAGALIAVPAVAATHPITGQECDQPPVSVETVVEVGERQRAVCARLASFGAMSPESEAACYIEATKTPEAEAYRQWRHDRVRHGVLPACDDVGEPRYKSP